MVNSMADMEVSKELWEEFLEFKKWKESQNDRKSVKMGNESVAGERNNGNNQGSNNGENTNRTETKAEAVTLQLQPNKPEVKEEVEEVECAGCGYKATYPINKYPDKCPNCGLEWR